MKIKREIIRFTVDTDKPIHFIQFNVEALSFSVGVRSIVNAPNRGKINKDNNNMT
jgi:hypothetical protein